MLAIRRIAGLFRVEEVQSDVFVCLRAIKSKPAFMFDGSRMVARSFALPSHPQPDSPLLKEKQTSVAQPARSVFDPERKWILTRKGRLIFSKAFHRQTSGGLKFEVHPSSPKETSRMVSYSIYCRSPEATDGREAVDGMGLPAHGQRGQATEAVRHWVAH